MSYKSFVMLKFVLADQNSSRLTDPFKSGLLKLMNLRVLGRFHLTHVIHSWTDYKFLRFVENCKTAVVHLSGAFGQESIPYFLFFLGFETPQTSSSCKPFPSIYSIYRWKPVTHQPSLSFCLKQGTWLIATSKTFVCYEAFSTKTYLFP